MHGLLHLLGFDHEGDIAEAQEMQGKEQDLLTALGWADKGLIASSTPSSPATVQSLGSGVASGSTSGSAGVTSRRGKAPPFRLLLCDMDGAWRSLTPRGSVASMLQVFLDSSWFRCQYALRP